MDNNSKKLTKFGTSKIMFTPNLGYKRNVAKNSTEKTDVDVKMEYDASSSTQSTIQKQKKTKERSTTQIQSVFSNMGSTSQGKLGSSRMGLSSGFRSYSNRGSFNASGSFVKTEGCQTQSIQQMQMFDNNQFDVDDPADDVHGPVRLPLYKKDKTPQIKSENSLEYPFQKNVYPLLSELLAHESLITLQFYDSSFSSKLKIPNINSTDNENKDGTSNIKETDDLIKPEYNNHNIETEGSSEVTNCSQPIGKVQYYRSGRVVLLFNGKKYELLKASEDKHHKELFSLTKIENSEKPDKLVSLGNVPMRLKAVMDISCILNKSLTINNS